MLLRGRLWSNEPEIRRVYVSAHCIARHIRCAGERYQLVRVRSTLDDGGAQLLLIASMSALCKFGLWSLMRSSVGGSGAAAEDDDNGAILDSNK
jgi:hypothetical protein